MPTETAADRAAFVNADEFGAVAIYTLFGGAAVPLAGGIFDDPHLSVVLGEAATDDSRPTFTLPTADLPPDAAPDAGDTIEVEVEGEGGVTYKVVGFEPDGTGFTRLVLGVAT